VSNNRVGTLWGFGTRPKRCKWHLASKSEGLPTRDLAADYSRALTGWADAFRSPTLASVTGASSDAPAAKVAGNVSFQSSVSSPGGNALGYALC
jgi:hypothetical protein